MIFKGEKQTYSNFSQLTDRMMTAEPEDPAHCSLLVSLRDTRIPFSAGELQGLTALGRARLLAEKQTSSVSQLGNRIYLKLCSGQEVRAKFRKD